MKPTQLRLIPGPLRAAACLAALAFAGQAHAAVTLTGTVTFDAGTGLYSYAYSVTNTGAEEDIALITIPVNPDSSLMEISSPTGFDLTFDPSQGWVNINEDSSILTEQTFAPGSTIAPFLFSSAYGPETITYTAFDALGTEFAGTVQAPITAPAPVPEGGSALLLLVLGMIGVEGLRRRHSS